MELGEVLLLPVVELLLIHQTYVVVLQLAEHLLRGSGVLPTVLLVELVHGLDGLLQDLAGCIAHMLALGQPGERSHADTGKLVEVVGIDAQERHFLEHGHTVLLSSSAPSLSVWSVKKLQRGKSKKIPTGCKPCRDKMK